ncbi:hypothetical protein [Muricoccus pecuniae]|uniref:Uncharacterized protein n=1 Tax=Muricoccus pecuniae TaxID=693023 RepID=A0A840Y709_9PROT|nr:hypothetical protein [Roseomonas pecuniae]MBB5695946.1 hypothetical protein [Roseomonas pecuniae]
MISGLAHEAKARERVGAAYVASVEAQRRRDTVEVPGLSRAAWTAVDAQERAQARQQEAEQQRLGIRRG